MSNSPTPWWVSALELALTILRISIKLVFLGLAFFMALIYGCCRHGKK